jgi:hypothetical protein
VVEQAPLGVAERREAAQRLAVAALLAAVLLPAEVGVRAPRSEVGERLHLEAQLAAAGWRRTAGLLPAEEGLAVAAA